MGSNLMCVYRTSICGCDSEANCSGAAAAAAAVRGETAGILKNPDFSKEKIGKIVN